MSSNIVKKDQIKFFSLILNVFCLFFLAFLILTSSKKSESPESSLMARMDDWHYEDNPFYANYMTNYNMYSVPKDIVLLGTSYTANAAWTELLDRNDIGARGINGDITAGMLARLDHIIQLHPKICFIEAGINDLFREIPLEEIVVNLNSIVDTLLAYDIIPVINTVVFANEQYQEREVEEFNLSIHQLNEQIRQIAYKKNLKLIDLNEFLSEHKFTSYAYSLPDGIHLNGKGYLIWKIEIEKILKEFNI